jgi:hypothetical protein
LPEDTYYLYADKLKIQSYMGWDKFHNAIDKALIDNSCLFVGQTLTDKAVCRDGTMLTVLNFEEEFTRLTKEFDHVYFSPHPMIKGDYSSQLEFLKQFDNVSIIKEPVISSFVLIKLKKSLPFLPLWSMRLAFLIKLQSFSLGQLCPFLRTAVKMENIFLYLTSYIPHHSGLIF